MTGLPNLRPSVVGKLNERRVLREIQARGPLSRADLVRQTDLSAPTVSKAVGSLIAAKLVEELAPPGPARGRPAAVVRLASATAQVLGVVVDAGTTAVIAAGLDGVVHTTSSVPTTPSYAELIDRVAAACRELMNRPGVTTFGVGVSLPGLLDYRAGTSVLSPNVHATDGHAPAADLAERLDCECVVIQEMHALCLAELAAGRAAGLSDFAILDVGVGVGLGVMTGGRLLKGHRGLAAELGHVTVMAEGGRPCGCGNAGCLETVASDAALAARLSERLGRPVGVPEAHELASAGGAKRELAEVAGYLGLGVAAVVNLFNPQAVFVHSELVRRDPKFLEMVRGAVAKRALPPSLAGCQVLPAQGTKPAGAVAAILRRLTDAVVPGLELD